MVGSRRQAWAPYGAMAVLMVGGMVTTTVAEQNGSPAQQSAGLEMAARDGTSGGNMEGKEVRNGIVASSNWASITTNASNGRSTPRSTHSPGLAGRCRSPT